MAILSVDDVHSLMDNLEKLIIHFLREKENKNIELRMSIENLNDQIELKINRLEISEPNCFLELKLRHLKIKLAYEQEDPESKICKSLENLINNYQNRRFVGSGQMLNRNFEHNRSY